MSVDRVRIDIYLRSVSGASLYDAVTSREVLTEDLARFQPEPEGREALLAHLDHLKTEGWLWSVEEAALLVRVYGLTPELSHILGCRVCATGHDRCDFEGTPGLPGYDRSIDAIESSGRVVRGSPAVRCAVLGHDWDILVFHTPYGLCECTRCGLQEGNLPVG
jgi:hypothetical protein